MRTIHRHLHLQHRQHTGRRLHHRHTSYRALTVIAVLAVGFMIGLNMMARATAATITVYARNPAPIPTEPAVITSPADGTIITKSKLLVEGTCPVMNPGVIVALLDNNTIIGSVPCGDDGRFSMLIVIDVGTHVLVARTYTITDDPGPDSAPVTVRHIIDTTQAATDSIGQRLGQETSLTVTIDEPFIVFGPGKDAIWTGTIKGGTLSYRVHMSWGDGADDTYTIKESGAQQFTHHYRSMSPHTITLQVTDAKGRSVIRYYAAVTPYVPPGFSVVPNTPWNGSLLLGLYGAYLLVLVVFGGLWARAHPVQYALVPVPVRRQYRRYRAGASRRGATSRRHP